MCVCVCVCGATGESEVLQTLNLSWNHIRKKGAGALATGLKVNLYNVCIIILGYVCVCVCVE